MLRDLMTATPHAENDVHSRNSCWAETWPRIGHGKINENANETPSALIQTKQYSGIMTLWQLCLSQSNFLNIWDDKSPCVTSRMPHLPL